MSLFFYNISVFNLLIKIVQATYLPPDRHAEVPRMISKDLGLATAATSGGIWLFPEYTSNVPELTKLSYVIMVDSCDRYKSDAETETNLSTLFDTKQVL